VGSGYPEVASAGVGFALPRAPGTGDMIAGMAGSVLIVDDDPVFRGLARRMLVAAGLVVVAEASTVASALEVAGRMRPDAARGVGVALAGQLSALPWRPRVVLTSTDADAATPDDVRAAGAGAFIPKDALPNAPLASLLEHD
jgi:DNA-binding NarL/FixJ family response regulator